MQKQLVALSSFVYTSILEWVANLVSGPTKFCLWVNPSVPAWEAASPPAKTRKGLLGRSKKRTGRRPVTPDTPLIINNVDPSLLFVSGETITRRSGLATPDYGNAERPAVTTEAASPALDCHPSPQAESTQATESLNPHPLARKEQQSVDYGYLVKDTAAETPGTLVMKRSSHGSIKSNPTSTDSRDSKISLSGENNDNHVKVITMKSSLEKQEIAKVSYNDKCLAI